MEKAHPGSAPSRTEAKVRLLVVDDDPQVRDVCIRLLRLWGYETASAATGGEAAARLGEEFDIVLSDLVMPGSVDGNELTRLVRSRTSSDVIIMTGTPEIETAIQALRDGAYDYLVKPFSEEALRIAITRCVDKRRLSKDLTREKALRSELDGAYRELSQMEMVRDIFGQFATPEVVRLVLDHPEDFRKRGEQKVITVLFADVRGFTPFADRVPPGEAVAALNEIFELVIEAVRSEGGILNKFIGDGLMALFGAPVAIKDHALAAAIAAIKARDSVESLARGRQAKGLEPLRMGFGLNTGEVVAGCVGTRERTEYSVVGTAVNVASRLEEAAGPGQILVGPETKLLLGPGFKLRDLGPVPLAGLEPLPVSELAPLS